MERKIQGMAALLSVVILGGLLYGVTAISVNSASASLMNCRIVQDTQAPDHAKFHDERYLPRYKLHEVYLVSLGAAIVRSCSDLINDCLLTQVSSTFPSSFEGMIYYHTDLS